MFEQTSRRKFIAGLTTAGLATALGVPALAAEQRAATDPAAGLSTAEPGAKASDALTSIYLIKNAQILSMDPAIGDFIGDILVENEEIIALQKHIVNAKATVIDGTGMIALPGFVETHWHLWTSMLRGLSGNVPGEDYFGMSVKYGKLFSPDNTYQSSRLALAEAISSGITYVHDWSHNSLSAYHVQASLKALKESGIRSRYSLGVASGLPDVDLQLLQELHQDWKSYANGGLISLGLAWPGIEKNRAAGVTEIKTARQLGLPVSVHAGRRKDKSDSVSQIAAAGYLGKDLQIVHGIDTTVEEYAQIAKSGATVSASPFSELRIGYGLTPAAEMLKSGAALGFSVDTMPLSGNADMFAMMKIFMNLAAGMERNEFAVTAKRVLEIATIEGAKSMGISAFTGSLSPGKKADIQLVNTRALNIGVVTDPYAVLTLAAQPANVDTVMLNGKLLKSKGKLTTVNVDQLLTEVGASLKALQQRAKALD